MGFNEWHRGSIQNMSKKSQKNLVVWKFGPSRCQKVPMAFRNFQGNISHLLKERENLKHYRTLLLCRHIISVIKVISGFRVAYLANPLPLHIWKKNPMSTYENWNRLSSFYIIKTDFLFRPNWPRLEHHYQPRKSKPLKLNVRPMFLLKKWTKFEQKMKSCLANWLICRVSTIIA